MRSQGFQDEFGLFLRLNYFYRNDSRYREGYFLLESILPTFFLHKTKIFFRFFDFKLGHFKEQTIFYHASNTQAYENMKNEEIKVW
jgi:hypothetical protein